MFNQRKFEQLFTELVESGAQCSGARLNALLKEKYEFLLAEYHSADLPALPDEE